MELGADDLRFRCWEIEELFNHYYHQTIVALDLADLHRRTGGWAAGLQLFHLATRGRSVADRRRILEGLGTNNRLLREYLTRNVLESLSPDLHQFLVLTCPLGVLTGDLCDRLLGTSGSEMVLAELERRQIFTTSPDDGRSFCYHEVLRSHLEGLLGERLGEAGAKAQHRRAAELLLELCAGGDSPVAGVCAAALRALCRAEAWEDAAALLGCRGEELAGTTGTWLENLPHVVVDNDPWLQLATARHHVANGSLDRALEYYRRCEALLPGSAREDCRLERVTVAAWASPMPSPASGWAGVLRRAFGSNPVLGAGGSTGSDADLPGVVGGVIALIAGNVARADLLFEAAKEADHPVIVLAADIGGSLCSILGPGGDRRALRTRLIDLAARAELLEQPWLSRLSQACLALTGQPEAAAAAAAACRRAGDVWGEAIASLLEGAALADRGKAAIAPLDRALGLVHQVGAVSLEAWALACLARAQLATGLPEAAATARQAESLARNHGIHGVQALSNAVLAFVGPNAKDHRRLSDQLASECGLIVPIPIEATAAERTTEVSEARWPSDDRVGTPAVSNDDGSPGPAGSSATGLSVKCLGGLEVRRHGRLIDLQCLRPRARSLLALLALSGSRSVHWEVLAEALWPEADGRSASRNLQTAVSSIRRALSVSGGPDHSELQRQGDTYVLLTDTCDVRILDETLNAARAHRFRDHTTDEMAALERALVVYQGDVLPEAGPAEWVVKERDRLRWEVAEAAERLAELELGRDHPSAAVSAAERGVAVDPYRDSLWRLLLAALERSGDTTRARKACERRAKVLAELGVNAI